MNINIPGTVLPTMHTSGKLIYIDNTDPGHNCIAQLRLLFIQRMFFSCGVIDTRFNQVCPVYGYLIPYFICASIHSCPSYGVDLLSSFFSLLLYYWSGFLIFSTLSVFLASIGRKQKMACFPCITALSYFSSHFLCFCTAFLFS